MQEFSKEKTALLQSAGTDSGQSICKSIYSITHESSVEPLETKTAAQIMNTFYRPRRGIVEGILCPGTNFLVGKPKVGKSFLVLQLAYHVSKGIPLGEFPVRQGTVLYLALEDNEQRIQERMNNMFGVSSSKNLHFANMSECIGNGLEEQLRDFISIHPDTVLIIIDTLAKVRQMDRHDYAADYDVISSLKKLTDLRDICILLVHHTRKQDADDVLDLVSGTNGLAGSADGIYVMNKESRTESDATMEIICRDLEATKLHLSFDGSRTKWKLDRIERNQFELPPNPLIEAIDNIVMNGIDYWEGTATDLVKLTGMIGMDPSIYSKELRHSAKRLLNEHHIEMNTGRTSYKRVITLTRIKQNEVEDDSNDTDDGMWDSDCFKVFAPQDAEGIMSSQMVNSDEKVALTKENIQKSLRESPEKCGYHPSTEERDVYA